MPFICEFHNMSLRKWMESMSEVMHDHTTMLIRIERRITLMSARESAAWAAYQENVSLIVDGYKSSRALNGVYEEQIAALHKNQQEKIDKAVQDALDSDSDADLNRIEAADEALDDVKNLPPLPTPERPKDSVPTDTVPDPETGHQTPPNVDPTTLPGERPDESNGGWESVNEEEPTRDPNPTIPTPQSNGADQSGDSKTGPADGGNSGSENVSFGNTGTESNPSTNS